MGNSIVSVRRLTAAAFLLACTVEFARAETADFYRGKTISNIVGFGPGGGYDLYARLVAKHLGAHIPGNPGFVVRNMPGAGSRVAGNFLSILRRRMAPLSGS